ncbi:hypothetical protein COCSADRAFT_254866 [Bipolaris sorokiniana ND90Pr]|uniref:Uncharacterized protein n=1 Tax=Cochliobolus sativus (strain ND90Pr / ATCC 201652) TaxID=665912 RepID=M2RXP5_COCSN|nr:uncharacterized protein COCSADRAFT_254866 [Bipolaris sorokiniana ND90Pr]EMD59833.1 hypothetical protein COCSADRAFT_254866 [Bipolaris sorokiniana ND90Pr]
MIRRRCRRPRLDWILAVSWTDLTYSGNNFFRSEMRSSEHRYRSTRRGSVCWLAIGLIISPLFSTRHILVLPAMAPIYQ